MPAVVKPYLIDFNKIGEPQLGYISVNEFPNLPFVPQRLFWTYHTPEEITRGRHAHHKTEQILIAAAGRIVVTTETLDNEILVFELSKPTQGLVVPANCWHTMQYSHNSVQLSIASTLYNESDYIRSYEEFKSLCKK